MWATADLAYGWALRNTNVPFDLAAPTGSCLVGPSSLTGGRGPNLSQQPIDFREISAKLATTWHYVGAAAGACGRTSRVGQASAAPSTWCAAPTPCERDGIVQRSVGSIGAHSSSQPRSRRGGQNSDSMMTAARAGLDPSFLRHPRTIGGHFRNRSRQVHRCGAENDVRSRDR
jgi:hypothetical protein